MSRLPDYINFGLINHNVVYFRVLRVSDFAGFELSSMQLKALEKRCYVEQAWMLDRLDSSLVQFECGADKFLFGFKESGIVVLVEQVDTVRARVNGRIFELFNGVGECSFYWMSRFKDGTFFLMFSMSGQYLVVKVLPRVGVFACVGYETAACFERKDINLFQKCPVWGVKHYFMHSGVV